MIVEIDDLKFEKANGFLVIDGLNGAGKSTIIKKLQDFLADVNPIFTREPGSGALGEKIREIILKSEDVPVISELLLFAADRAQHVANIIQPALEKNVPVVSDRYYYSTTAFQGYGRGFDLDTINELNTIAIQNVKPDLVILLDLDPLIGLKRNSESSEKSLDDDTFEKEELLFHTNVRKGYLEVAKNSEEKFLIINAEQEEEKVWEDVQIAVKEWKQCLK